MNNDIVTILEDLDGPITDEDRQGAAIEIRELRAKVAQLEMI